MRDAPWIVECSLEFGMEAEGRYAPRPPHGPNIWQAFDATSRRCVEHTGLEACRCARRPGWLNAAWSFEWKLRGATRPDLDTALTSGNRLMPRAEGASSTPDWKFEFSETFRKNLLGTQNDPLGRSGRSCREPQRPFLEPWESIPGPGPPQGCVTYGSGVPCGG